VVNSDAQNSADSPLVAPSQRSTNSEFNQLRLASRASGLFTGHLPTRSKFALH
jgi:hypothetical protein